MTIVISILSLFVALAAVWFSSEATRRMQEAQKRFAETYIKPLKHEMEGLDKKIDRIATSLNELAKKYGESSGELTALEAKIEIEAKNVAELGQKLDALDRSIPPKVRIPTSGTNAH
ncbi:MAG: hypothetical protein OQJ99_08535 [Rhodospirillales bacterium]|nr:hypothetical protein [Rhodospirillales bacterium]MCW8951639.1 hypothetical protein [Rhodospirillales bacterium]MCW9001639.1 hypothetical protein [Rhodospirillales bacterium]